MEGLEIASDKIGLVFVKVLHDYPFAASYGYISYGEGLLAGITVGETKNSDGVSYVDMGNVWRDESLGPAQTWLLKSAMARDLYRRSIRFVEGHVPLVDHGNGKRKADLIHLYSALEPGRVTKLPETHMLGRVEMQGLRWKITPESFARLNKED